MLKNILPSLIVLGIICGVLLSMGCKIAYVVEDMCIVEKPIKKLTIQLDTIRIPLYKSPTCQVCVVGDMVVIHKKNITTDYLNNIIDLHKADKSYIIK